MERKYVQLGSFEMTGAVMRVSDPCYDKTTLCSGTISNCLTGQWDAAVAYIDENFMGRRVSMLAAKHSDTVDSFTLCDQVWADEANCHYASGWEVCDIEVGVDSGQAGFFDEDHYQDGSVYFGQPKPASGYGDIWYSHCCYTTEGKCQAGIIPYGVVSRSGYGDGCYTALAHKHANGQIDCVVLLYLSEAE